MKFDVDDKVLIYIKHPGMVNARLYLDKIVSIIKDAKYPIVISGGDSYTKEGAYTASFPQNHFIFNIKNKPLARILFL